MEGLTQTWKSALLSKLIVGDEYDVNSLVWASVGRKTRKRTTGAEQKWACTVTSHRVGEWKTFKGLRKPGLFNSPWSLLLEWLLFMAEMGGGKVLLTFVEDLLFPKWKDGYFSTIVHRYNWNYLNCRGFCGIKLGDNQGQNFYLLKQKVIWIKGT